MNAPEAIKGHARCFRCEYRQDLEAPDMPPTEYPFLALAQRLRELQDALRESAGRHVRDCPGPVVWHTYGPFDANGAWCIDNGAGSYELWDPRLALAERGPMPAPLSPP